MLPQTAAAAGAELIEFLEPGQLVANTARPVPPARLSTRTRAALWALRIFVLSISIMVIYRSSPGSPSSPADGTGGRPASRTIACLGAEPFCICVATADTSGVIAAEPGMATACDSEDADARRRLLDPGQHIGLGAARQAGRGPPRAGSIPAFFKISHGAAAAVAVRRAGGAGSRSLRSSMSPHAGTAAATRLAA